MTPRNGPPEHVTGNAKVSGVNRDVRRVRSIDVPFSAQIWARLFASRYDDQIEAGVVAAAGTALAAHHRRLASRRERLDMADALTHLLGDASRLSGGSCCNMRVPIQTDAVKQSAEVVEDVVARLRGPLPIHARGMARLRILLGDGRSSVYRSGQGTFAAAMRGVLAAM